MSVSKFASDRIEVSARFLFASFDDDVMTRFVPFKSWTASKNTYSNPLHCTCEKYGRCCASFVKFSFSLDRTTGDHARSI